jgi:hypothetical protein
MIPYIHFKDNMSHAIENGVQLVLNNCNNFQLHMLFATKKQLQNINFLLVIMLDHKVGIIFGIIFDFIINVLLNLIFKFVYVMYNVYNVVMFYCAKGTMKIRPFLLYLRMPT